MKGTADVAASILVVRLHLRAPRLLVDGRRRQGGAVVSFRCGTNKPISRTRRTRRTLPGRSPTFRCSHPARRLTYGGGAATTVAMVFHKQKMTKHNNATALLPSRLRPL